VLYRGLQYVFESVLETNFYFDDRVKIYDPKTGLTINDQIKILKINSQADSASPLALDYTWYIYKNITEVDGFENPNKILVTFSDLDNDGIPDNPELFELLVNPEINIIDKFVYFQATYGYDNFVIQTPVSNSLVEAQYNTVRDIRVAASLYKDGQILETVNLLRLPEDSLSRMHIYSCKDWLLQYGAGCYEVRISGDVGGITFEYVYGKYRLLPYNSVTSRNQFRLRCYNDKFTSSESVNFANSGYFDDIRLGGRFGQMQPKTVVDNLVYHDRVTRSIINENIPEYTMDSNKVNPLLVTKLVKMILQSTNIEASDYNRYAPDFIRNLEVILPKEGQGLLLEYLGLTQDRIVSCQFRKKLLNERTFTK
jgi:hypothetical protein